MRCAAVVMLAACAAPSMVERACSCPVPADVLRVGAPGIPVTMVDDMPGIGSDLRIVDGRLIRCPYETTLARGTVHGACVEMDGSLFDAGPPQ